MSKKTPSRRLKILLLVSLLPATIIWSSSPRGYGAHDPNNVASIQPIPQTLLRPADLVGTTFDWPVDISNARDLFAWQVTVLYDPTVLTVKAMLLGSYFDKEVRKTRGVFLTQIDNDAGSGAIAFTFLGQDPIPLTCEVTIPCPATLVTVRFSVMKTSAFSSLHILTDTEDHVRGSILVSAAGHPNTEILYNTEDGFYTNNPDIAPPNAEYTITSNPGYPIADVDSLVSFDAGPSTGTVSYGWRFGDKRDATVEVNMPVTLALNPNSMESSLIGSVTADVIFVGLGNTSDFAALGSAVFGRIALIQRGEILFREKVANAVASGAVGAMIFNNQAGNFLGTLLEPSAIPVVSMSDTEGLMLKGFLDSGETVNVTLSVGSTGVTGTHTYTTGGSFRTVLEVKGSTPGTFSRATKILIVQTEPPPPPRAQLAVTVSMDSPQPKPGEPVTFTANATGGTPPYSYHWNTGDGTTAFGNPITHEYSEGVFTVTLNVTDADGTSTVWRGTFRVYVPTPVLRVDNAEITGVVPGSSFKISIVVANMPAFNAYDIRVGFDPTVFRVTTVSFDGSLFAQSGLSIVGGVGTEESPGILRITQSVLNGDLTGTGLLATITFQALDNPFVSPIDIGLDDDLDPTNDQNLLVAASNNLPIPHDTVDAVINRYVSPFASSWPTGYPTAMANGPYSGTEGSPVRFDGARSTDLDGEIVDLAWDFGDGTTGAGIHPTHSYRDNGVYIVGLTVTDNDGLSRSTSSIVMVNNLPPFVTVGPDQSVLSGDLAEFTGSFFDPGALDTHEIVWDFGDGSSVSGILDPKHTYFIPGTYMVTLVITDDDGGVGSASLTVTVKPIPVSIDIKLGSPVNTVNLRSLGRVGVAILTTPGFDVTTVEISTVRFGATGTEAAPVHSILADIDGDGDLDLLLLFGTQDIMISPGDTLGLLSGQTLDDRIFSGSDAIETFLPTSR